MSFRLTLAGGGRWGPACHPRPRPRPLVVASSLSTSRVSSVLVSIVSWVQQPELRVQQRHATLVPRCGSGVDGSQGNARHRALWDLQTNARRRVISSMGRGDR